MKPSDAPPAGALPAAVALTGIAVMVAGALLLALVPAPARPVRAAPPVSPLASALGPALYRLPLVAPEDPDRAIAFYLERVTRDPGGLNLAQLASAYLAKARAGGSQHYWLLAEQAARRSLDALPFSNESAKLVLARVAEARHDFARAVTLANDVLAREPRSAEALAVLTACGLATGRLDEALLTADRLVKTTATAGTLWLRASVLMARGEDAAAAADLKRALPLEEPGEVQTSARVRVLLARVAARRGAAGTARALLREALRIAPRNAGALLTQAELAQDRESVREAALALEAADKASPAPAMRAAAARAWMRAGDEARARSLRKSAEGDLRREVEGGATGHRRDLALVLLDEGRAAEARALLEEELKVRKDAVTLEALERARRASP